MNILVGALIIFAFELIIMIGVGVLMPDRLGRILCKLSGKAAASADPVEYAQQLCRIHLQLQRHRADIKARGNVQDTHLVDEYDEMIWMLRQTAQQLGHRPLTASEHGASLLRVCEKLTELVERHVSVPEPQKIETGNLDPLSDSETLNKPAAAVTEDQQTIVQSDFDSAPFEATVPVLTVRDDSLQESNNSMDDQLATMLLGEDDASTEEPANEEATTENSDDDSVVMDQQNIDDMIKQALAQDDAQEEPSQDDSTPLAGNNENPEQLQDTFDQMVNEALEEPEVTAEASTAEEKPKGLPSDDDLQAMLDQAMAEPEPEPEPKEAVVEEKPKGLPSDDDLQAMLDQAMAEPDPEEDTLNEDDREPQPVAAQDPQKKVEYNYEGFPDELPRDF